MQISFAYRILNSENKQLSTPAAKATRADGAFPSLRGEKTVTVKMSPLLRRQTVGNRDIVACGSFISSEHNECFMIKVIDPTRFRRCAVLGCLFISKATVFVAFKVPETCA